MTIFDLDEKKATWFDMDGGGRVQLRLLSADDWKAIRAQSVKRSPVYEKLDGKWERFDTETKDEDLQNELFWDAAIVAWENLQDGKGTEILCTIENKVLLMMTQPKFSRFVGECVDVLTKDETVRAEAFEKNSLTGSHGTTNMRPAAQTVAKCTDKGGHQKIRPAGSAG